MRIGLMLILEAKAEESFSNGSWATHEKLDDSSGICRTLAALSYFVFLAR